MTRGSPAGSSSGSSTQRVRSSLDGRDPLDVAVESLMSLALPSPVASHRRCWSAPDQQHNRHVYQDGRNIERVEVHDQSDQT